MNEEALAIHAAISQAAHVFAAGLHAPDAATTIDEELRNLLGRYADATGFDVRDDAGDIVVSNHYRELRLVRTNPGGGWRIPDKTVLETAPLVAEALTCPEAVRDVELLDSQRE